MSIWANSPRAALVLLLAFASSAQAGGRVDVVFVDQKHFTDAGWPDAERGEVLGQLAAHIQALGARYLAEGQTLSVEVLDVDLAGQAKPWQSRGAPVRILRGKADWPRMDLRYTLLEDGKPVSAGRESIADLAYLDRVGQARMSVSLAYERRMLDDWFRGRFVEGRAAR